MAHSPGACRWANDGVDPALYSKELMSHLEAAVESAEVQVRVRSSGVDVHTGGSGAAEGCTRKVPSQK